MKSKIKLTTSHLSSPGVELHVIGDLKFSVVKGDDNLFHLVLEGDYELAGGRFIKGSVLEADGPINISNEYPKLG